MATGAAAGSGTGGAPQSAPAFRGVTDLILDAKGRLAVPARHRETLAATGDARLVITADPSGCLLVYPRVVWEPIQQRLMGLSGFDERIRALQRLLVGHADDAELDSSGRILVAPALRAFAHLDREVVLVGQGRRFELWNAPQWQAQTVRAIAFDAGGLPPELDGFTL
ncbi:MAG: division/cell wall cluster transcriptional repressor MraZ [Casimicrobiaceae bacterium]